MRCECETSEDGLNHRKKDPRLPKDVDVDDNVPPDRRPSCYFYQTTGMCLAVATTLGGGDAFELRN